jgi:CheY-like chemotaxis protein
MQCVQRRRILIVDDMAINLYLLQSALETEGYEVDTASNGFMALAKIEASPPDLVLLDIMMPGMNGYEVTRHLRQNDKFSLIPIILITASDEASVPEGLGISEDDFIRKPINFDKLLARIQACWN